MSKQLNTWAVLASGPSMSQQDADYLRGKCKTIVVNTTFRLAPWADALYTNDHDWLGVYLQELYGGFDGEIWCGHKSFAGVDGVNHVPFDKDAKGLAPKPGHIAWGMNSGGGTISLLINHFKLITNPEIDRLILLGFDQQWTGGKPRWHGRHPEKLQNQKPGFHRWATWFDQAAKDAESMGVEIINCSRSSSLTCFKKQDIESVI